MLSFLGISVLYLRLTVVLSDCGAPPQIDNASHNLTQSAPFPVGTHAKFRCDLGYEAVGLSSYDCVGDTWVGGPYRCVETLCRFIDPPDNGIISGNPDYTIGSEINFACDEGYNFLGDSRLRCRVDGWFPKNSRQECRPKNCGPFDDVQNGRSFQEAPDGIYDDYGSEVTVSCDPGYTLSGKAKVVCSASGSWTEKPTCTPYSCPDYPGLNSSCIERVTVDATLITIECINDPLKVTKTGSDEYSFCHDNNWMDDGIACYCNCECSAKNKNVLYSNCNSGNYLPHGQLLTWTCKQGFHKGSGPTIKCMDGKFSHKPQCLEDKCHDFGEVQNAQLIPTWQNNVKNSVGSLIKVHCNKGYVISSGSSRVKCQSNLQWGPKPHCVETQCPKYPGVDSECIKMADYDSQTHTLSVVCKDDDYVTRTGPNSTHCDGEQWADVSMACWCGCSLQTDYDGAVPDHIDAPSIKHGETLEWHCGQCYMKSSPQVICDDGRLSTTPKCNFSFGCQIMIAFIIGAAVFVFCWILLVCCSAWFTEEKKRNKPGMLKQLWLCIYCGPCVAYAHDKVCCSLYLGKNRNVENGDNNKEMKPLRLDDDEHGDKPGIRTETLTMVEAFDSSVSEFLKRVTAEFPGRDKNYDEELGYGTSSDGLVTARVISLEGEKAVMAWRLQNWPDGHFSEVILEFKEKNGSRKLHLTQQAVPADHIDDTREHWKKEIFQRAK